MKRKTIRRLWHGLASLRDYEVKRLIDNNESVCLKCGEEEMVLTPEDLLKGFDSTKKQHTSIYNVGQKYKLVDFRWKPTKQMELGL